MLLRLDRFNVFSSKCIGRMLNGFSFELSTKMIITLGKGKGKGKAVNLNKKMHGKGKKDAYWSEAYSQDSSLEIFK